MIQRIFTVYDQKAKAFLPPFFLPETGMATRVFTDCVNDASHQFFKHPEDYNLYEIGTFDDNFAKIEALEPSNLLGSGVMFLQPDNQQDLFPEPSDAMPEIAGELSDEIRDDASIQPSSEG